MSNRIININSNYFPICFTIVNESNDTKNFNRGDLKTQRKIIMLKNFWNKSHINFGPPPQKTAFFGGGPTFMILERCNDRIKPKIFFRKQKYISDAEKKFFGWKTKNDKKKIPLKFSKSHKKPKFDDFSKKIFWKKNSQNF